MEIGWSFSGDDARSGDRGRGSIAGACDFSLSETRSDVDDSAVILKHRPGCRGVPPVSAARPARKKRKPGESE